MRRKLLATFCLILIAGAVFSGEVLVLDFTSELVQKKLGKNQSVDVQDGAPVLTMTQDKPGLSLLEIPLDIATVANKDIVLAADIKQNNISAKPKSWNGVKLMLVITGADGKKLYPQAPNADGSADWKRHFVSARIPADATALSLLLGLENVTGTVNFRAVKVTEAVPPEEYSHTTVTGWTDRENAVYQPGETMQFNFQILESENSIPGNVNVIFACDDGRTWEKSYAVETDRPLTVSASLDKPGFVMVKAQLLTPSGTVAKRLAWNGSLRQVQYGLAGGVDMEQLRQGEAEPADFDEFWRKAKAELADVPVEVLERKLCKQTEQCDIFDMKIACAGNRPVSGYLSIPMDAKAKSLPIRMRYDGYGVHNIAPYSDPRAIVFFINAHGIENGRKKAYYAGLAKGELSNYGFRNEQNEKPETCYFRNMILRGLRAFEYAKTLPEWNGKDVVIAGGSQGAFQAVAVAALAPAATKCDISIPWFCDLGGVNCGRVRGWRPDWQAGLGYYDTVNFAKRVTCPVKIKAGLSDWVCPPSGVWILYNNLSAPKEMVMYQGWDHAVYFGYDAERTAKMTYLLPAR